MSDDNLAARMAARVQPGKAKPVSEAFRSPSEDTHRTTVYLPVSVHKGLKRAALDEDTTVSAILTELADQYLKAHKR